MSLPYFDYERAAPWNLIGATLNDIELINSCFKEILVFDVDFSNTNLTGADFREADLSEVDFCNANLTDANFENCFIKRCNFTGANLSTANFTNSKIFFGTLAKANLSKTNLTGAKIVSVELENANISDAITKDTIFKQLKSGPELGLSQEVKDAIAEYKKIMTIINPPERWEKY